MASQRNGTVSAKVVEATELAAEVAAREEAIRERAFAAAKQRERGADPIREWLDAYLEGRDWSPPGEAAHR